jgi:hypothetical protein
MLNNVKRLWSTVKAFLTDPRVVFFVVIGIFFLNLFDAGMSWWFVSMGYAYEVNPLMAALMSISFYLFFAVKVFLGSFLAALCIRKVHITSIQVALWFLFAVYSFLCLNHVIGTIFFFVFIL